jgi:hypothetical protein
MKAYETPVPQEARIETVDKPWSMVEQMVSFLYDTLSSVIAGQVAG